MSEFQCLGIPHLTAITLTILLPVALAVLVRKANLPTATRTVCYLLGAILLTNEVGHWCYRLFRGEFSLLVREFLPIHVCGLATFATVFTLLLRNQKLYECAYFWGLVGTFNAIITPELEVSFPHYRFFQYFVGHSGVVVGVLFATWGLRMRPTLKSLFRSFFLINLYMVFIAGFNLLVKTNYLFLCEAPDTKSPFFFAPWPWYIPIVDGIALVFFFLVYAPFFISDWMKRRRAQLAAY
ncbi:MAG: TIGR02206 family membrane protein [Candidatus Poribacteria bacterium]|nr:TIGR02206 family membrane protein [Candidatus Poribacteria bacterium]